MFPPRRIPSRRKMRLSARVSAAALAAAVAVCLGMSPPQPADFDAQHAEAVSRNPSDLHLRLSFAGGRTQFHLGELIKVQYELTADTPGKYKSGDLWYDLSDRSRFKSFVSDRPADSADPLEGHWTIWETLYGAHMTRRSGSWKNLTENPLVEAWDLNDYLRFDRPGKYRIYATTRHIVADWSPSHDPFAGGPPLTSNILEVEILPDDPAWSADKLQHALESLILSVRDQRAHLAAAKTIRFLQTREALDAMASHYTGADREADAQLLSGLIGFHDHAAAVRRMELQLVASEFGVSRFFLFSLAVMKLRLASPDLSAADLLHADKPTVRLWRHKLFDVLLPYYERLIPAAEKKLPRARALTVDTLFHTSALETFDFEKLPLPAEQVEALRLRELAILPDLPPYEQFDRIANFGWAKTLPPDQVLAALRKVYEHPSGELSGNLQQTRKYVLKDVNAISPEEGQTLLALAIEEPHAALQARDVSDLSLTPSPELDAMLIAKLEGRRTEEMKSAAPLIGRYASPALLERVRAVYEVEKEAWPCPIESGLLAYFLRVDPAYGEKMFPAAAAFAASRQQTSCQRPSLVGAISDLFYSPFLEQQAIAQLDDADFPLVTDAIRTLSTHSSGPALAALLDRFRRFHEEWKAFDREKSPPEIVHKWESKNQANLELTLARALAQSPGYRRQPEMLQQLAQLCITDACRSETLRYAR
jgi:hypothetical protein